VKYTITLLILSVLLVACAHQDSKVREQIIGTWSHGDTAELILAADGTFVSKVKRDDGDEKLEGTWRLKDGALITKTVHTHMSYRPGVTNIHSVDRSSDPQRTRVFLPDPSQLVAITEATLYRGARTNVWERR
jgi:hypothetical protein